MEHKYWDLLVFQDHLPQHVQEQLNKGNLMPWIVLLWFLLVVKNTNRHIH